jgi:cell division protease FtsH
MQRPARDQFLLTATELSGRLRGLLGGRAAEEIIFDEVSTGAQNDLERATGLARQMVAVFGMSPRLGLTHCAQPVTPFPGLMGDGQLQRDCSEQTAREIDEEVRRLLQEALDEARHTLLEHRDQLEEVTQELIARESIDGPSFYEMIHLTMPRAKERAPVPASAEAATSA